MQVKYWFYCFLWTKCFEIGNEVTLVIRLYNLFQIYPNSSEKEAKWYFSLQRFSLEHFKQFKNEIVCYLDTKLVWQVKNSFYCFLWKKFKNRQWSDDGIGLYNLFHIYTNSPEKWLNNNSLFKDFYTLATSFILTMYSLTINRILDKCLVLESYWVK